MIYIKKGRKKYPVVNTPVSKLFLIECENNYPHGYYINDGKKLTFSKPNIDYKKFDIKIDFINSLKIGGVILSFVYLVALKRRVVNVGENFWQKRKDILDKINEDIKKKAQMNEPFSFDEEE